MPTQEIPELDQYQVSRICSLALYSRAFKNKAALDTSSLIAEVNRDFARTMNKIIFDKHIKSKGRELIAGNLSLPPEPPPKQVPYFALISIPPHNFPEEFSSFCFSTLYIKSESIWAMEQINTESLEVLEKEIFNTAFTKRLRLEDFRQIEEASIQQCAHHLKDTWISKVRDIIKRNFGHLQKGWFNLNETSYEVYQMGKLKKFLQCVKIRMQEIVKFLSEKSIAKYVEAIIKFVPATTTVQSSLLVENMFLDVTEDKKAPPPLFSIELQWPADEKLPKYNVDPKTVNKIILDMFDKGVNDLQSIPQVEPKLLPHFFKTLTKSFLKAPERPRVAPPSRREPSDIEDENMWVWKAYKKLEEEIEKVVAPMEEYLQTYEEFYEVNNLNPDTYMENYDDDENPMPIPEVRKDILKNAKEEQKILEKIPKKIINSYFQIDCRNVRNLLSQKHAKIMKDEIQLIAKRCRQQTEEILTSFEEIRTNIKKVPKDIEELTEIKEYMNACGSDVQKQQLELRTMMQSFDILEEFKCKFPFQDLDKKWEAFRCPKDIYELMEKQNDYLEKEKGKFLSQMETHQKDFAEKLDDLEQLISKFSEHQEISEYEEVVRTVNHINQKLKSNQEESSTYNRREGMIGKDQTDYSQVSQMMKDFLPYSNLWNTIATWYKSHNSWLHDPWDELDAGNLEEVVEKSSKTMASVNRYFKDKGLPAILKIAENIKQEIDVFKPYVPLAVALRTEGMKDRHWDSISHIMGFDVRPTGDFTFNTVMKKGLLNKKEQCQETAEKAGKEYAIECNLTKMKEDWEDVVFKTPPFKQSGTFYVLGFEEAGVILDDQVMLTQQMMASFFKKQFENEINEWNAILDNMSQVQEEWVKCQGSYLYLQPIFESPDIKRQLPSEFKKFNEVDKGWREIMKETKANPGVLRTCSREGLFEKFLMFNEELEKVQKGLSNYLEDKRTIFARFYFLSNDDLLEILSKTKEVEKVQPFLVKVFENIHELRFIHPSKHIVAMYSKEHECIEFSDHVDPTKDSKGVEFWMGEVEDMMVISVRRVFYEAIQDYLEVPRIDWVLKHPAQTVLNASQVHFASQLEGAMDKEGYKGAKTYWDSLQDQLMDTVDLVRKKLTKLQSITLNALIVVDVHAKDLVESLWREQINNHKAFEWISQVRYYWEDNNCFVRCVQTNFPYGYEYLGNTLRLVITPLTDKCFITLMGALKLNLGGSPAGPAGTGKTESVKDLSKGVAKQCVVFNCSPQMNYKMVGNFFKGLASAGAWCCFDEFNRINIEVLSVIAQQLQDLFTAKAQGVEELNFEDSLIKMKVTFSVFITMNPGYAGRTELPDNLKALFRPMAMMVPDYALIATIMLYSFGFKTANDLARKMVATFKLSSEQLSAQRHYDYGMRAVSSVISTAGLLKRATPDMNEDQLLLRALRDVNVPKFLKDDLPLFENIIKDLFPGVERPVIDYGKLIDAIKLNCVEFSKTRTLQPTEAFVEKVTQLYDTTQVRHGLMLVGPSGGGKTACYQVLAKAESSLEKEENFSKVEIEVINPKSITLGQLYGEMDKLTNEWVDGIGAILIANAARDTQGKANHWILFDGPVDSIWIESMNTVLDDNKKLCLNSGAIVHLTDFMTMMFEVEDLQEASPATVSRCGMVYLDPANVGFKNLFKSWAFEIPLGFKECKTFIPTLEKMFNIYIEKCVFFLRNNLMEPVPTTNNNVVPSVFRLIDTYLEDYRETEIKPKISKEEVEFVEHCIPAIFTFSIIWALGVTTNEDGRTKFDTFIRELITPILPDFPEEGTVYDYVFDISDNLWKPWTETVPRYEADIRKGFLDIMVPTPDSIRMIAIMRRLLTNDKHVLTAGPTGTGKSVNIQELMSRGLPEMFQSVMICFSAQTSANQTQDTLDDKFQRRRKGVYGPPTGKKYIIFIDDLNMPRKEVYGAQPPIEIIRQWMDHKSWFNRKVKDKVRMTIQDIVFIAAMGPPGGGRSYITQRMERHFNIVTYTDLDTTSINKIFLTILTAFLCKFDPSVVNILPKIMEQTINIYYNVIKELLPTPAKSHYTFNLRDISKIIQGCCSAYIKSTQEAIDLVRLWIHENHRVFGDRLVSTEDKQLLNNMLEERVEQEFGFSHKDIYLQERIIFGDYMNGIEVDPRYYIMVSNTKELVEKIEGYLEDYNAESRHQMKLVMFLDACDHVSRICRVLRQPQGHALLLGVGGSGRQSLARLASFISNIKCFNVEVIKGYNMEQWKSDLKDILKTAGVQDKPTTFLFVDTQIIDEEMLEHINNILNTGDVPNLYKKEDQEDIDKAGYKECLAKGLPTTKMNKFTQYLAKIKKNIHVVLAMSPLGDVFTSRLRKFPSLVNCCTIDWFTEWPEEALLGVGRGAVLDSDLDLEDKLEPIVNMFKIMHQSVEQKSKDFYETMRRRNYVTPTSYLELLSTFKTIMNSQKNELNKQIKRLETGLDVLFETNKATDELKLLLEKRTPELIETQKNVKIMKEKLIVDYNNADETKKVVQVEEEQASRQQEEASKLKNDAALELKKAEPALNAAVAVLKNLKDNDFYEIKSMQVPTEMMLTIFEAVAYLLKFKFTKPKDLKAATSDPQGIFECAKKQILAEPKKCKSNLIDYDKDHIEDQIIAKVNVVRERPNWDVKRAKNASMPLYGMYLWVEAMCEYHKILKIVNPMRAKVKELTAILMEVEARLAEKREQLNALNEKIRGLEKEQQAKVQLEKELTQEITACKLKLERAGKLIKGLQGEKIRWGETVKKMQAQKGCLFGDCLLSSGMVSYSGCFTSDFRAQLEELWNEELDGLELVHSEKLTMRLVLGDDVKIRMWNVFGLPYDTLSVENGIILHSCRRWPLMIDPQNQANNFIKKYGADTEGRLTVLKASDDKIIKSLESAIELGKWVLLERVGQSIDPSLEPLLLQQKIKVGTSWTLKLAERSLKYDESFRFYMTTTLPNPHYAPETMVMVTILNFAITPSGLESQMLNQLIELEMPELQEKKNMIVSENAKDAKTLRENEDKILAALSSKKPDEILDDEGIINDLEEAKQQAELIQQRVEESKVMEGEIDAKRNEFRSVAFRASILFFCILDLSTIDPMYQYSLQWFQQLFALTVQNSAASIDVQERVVNLNTYFTMSLYKNICRSLFNSHKLLFSFLLNTKMMFGDNKIDMREWRYFLTGPSGEIDIPENPLTWIGENEWPTFYRYLHGLDQIPKYEGFKDFFLSHTEEFRKVYDSPNAHEEPLPGDWNSKLDMLQKMLVIKLLRSDKLMEAIRNFVIANMGEDFTRPPVLNLQDCFNDSTNISPLIFILSTGSDPKSDFDNLVEAMEMNNRINSMSLGQGQAKKAENMIADAQSRGGWVLLQNCHLSLSWMPGLEVVVENFNPESSHKDFRLWLTSMPDPHFPVSTLQNSVKMTIEPPEGLKANMLRTYQGLDDRNLTNSSKPDVFKKLLFGFCFFHAIVQDRRKFGPIGWNILYEFSNEDLKVCTRQLRLFVDEYEEVPYKVLNYLGAEINYGGRVTDDKDKRLINNILSDICKPEIFEDGFKFSPSGVYYSPKVGAQEDYLNYVISLPDVPSPEVFGMHENAAITTAMSETRITLEIILSIQPRTSGVGGKSRDEQILDLVTFLQSKTPPKYNFVEVQEKFPVMYEESMNTVLVQEIRRYNKLLVEMKESLIQLAKAVKGFVVMSEDLEKMGVSLFDSMVPENWSDVKDTGFLSLKPLASWIVDLNNRVVFLAKWIAEEIPPCVWFSGNY